MLEMKRSAFEFKAHVIYGLNIWTDASAREYRPTRFHDAEDPYLTRPGSRRNGLGDITGEGQRSSNFSF